MLPTVDHNTLETLILVAVTLLGWYMKRQFDKKDKKDDKIALLIEQREAEKETAIREWRAEYKATLCSIKTTVETIKTDMNHRVHHDDCVREHKEVWDAVGEMRKEIYAK
jgi:hypothetical protein